MDYRIRRCELRTSIQISFRCSQDNCAVDSYIWEEIEIYNNQTVIVTESS